VCAVLSSSHWHLGQELGVQLPHNIAPAFQKPDAPRNRVHVAAYTAIGTLPSRDSSSNTREYGSSIR
jgi:hypothetical protein